MDLEESPWREGQQSQQGWANMAGGGQPWAPHHSPQQASRRNPWDPNTLAQNLNEALGISGGGPAPQVPWAGEPDFNQMKQLWNEPHMEQQQHYAAQMHPHAQGGMMNGLIDPAAVAAAAAAGGDWAIRGEQGLWSDPLKQDEQYWKQQQQGGWGQQQPQRWNPQMAQHPHAPPPHRGMVRPGGGWNAPNGMMQAGGQPKPMWNQNMGGPAMGQRGPPRPFHPRGIDMSVPPPIEMPFQGMGGMRGAPPPGSHMWKPEAMGGAPNGMRPPYGQPNVQPFPMQKQPFEEESMAKFAPTDDMMWHDPNGDLKKWQRDMGVSVWGDPEKAALRPVQNWLVGENEEEDLETALSKCPVPQKRSDAVVSVTGVHPADVQSGPSTSSRAPLPIPPKRQIVVTGWGELPDNDPNNPGKSEIIDSAGGTEKWGDSNAPSDAPWYLPAQQAQGYQPDGPPAWGQPPPGGAPGQPIPGLQPMGPGGALMNTEMIADHLRLAVDKGYLDISVLTGHNLPPTVLGQMNGLLAKIPILEGAEQRLTEFIDSTRPEGETDNSSPPRWLNDVQMVEYNRLIIEVTTARIEVTDLSKKMQRAIDDFRADNGMPPVSAPAQLPAGHDQYNYSFLE